MKLLISILAFIPAFAFAAATTVNLDFSKESDLKDQKLCIYKSDIYLGNENTITPFQLLARQPDGTLATLIKPDVIHQAKNGQFYIGATAVRYVQPTEACPAKAQLILIK